MPLVEFWHRWKPRTEKGWKAWKITLCVVLLPFSPGASAILAIAFLVWASL